MKESSGTRWAPRYELCLPIRYQVPPDGPPGGHAGFGQTRDVSETGACLDLPEPLPTGTRMGLVVDWEAGPLAVEATVVWGERSSPSGGRLRHGVAFSILSPEQQRSLEGLLRRLGTVRTRIAVPEPLPLRARATLEVQLLDLSLGGARIAHHSLLRPGAPCALEFPSSRGPLVLTARVTRSTVVGVDGEATGDRLLRYESGLAFVNLTPEQQTALARVLDRLGSGGGMAGFVTIP